MKSLRSTIFLLVIGVVVLSEGWKHPDEDDDEDATAGDEGDFAGDADEDLPQGRGGGASKPKPTPSSAKIQGAGLGDKGVKIDAKGEPINCLDKGYTCAAPKNSADKQIPCCGDCVPGFAGRPTLGECGAWDRSKAKRVKN